MKPFTMRVLAITLCLLATPALADVTGPARVIDGDTLEVQGERVRLHGIDAPESRQLCFIDGKPWQCGKDAANALADKIAHQPSSVTVGSPGQGTSSARETIIGQGFPPPYQSDKGRSAIYRTDLGPGSCWHALCAIIAGTG